MENAFVCFFLFSPRNALSFKIAMNTFFSWEHLTHEVYEIEITLEEGKNPKFLRQLKITHLMLGVIFLVRTKEQFSKQLPSQFSQIGLQNPL